MPFDINNQYSGTFLGKDRLGFTTPDPEASEPLRPFLAGNGLYPAPWLAGRRRDEGHPVGAQVVLSSGCAVGKDKAGALVPAGMRSGDTGEGGPYEAVVYGQDDVGFAYNPQTGVLVQAPGEFALLAAPTDAATGNVTLQDGTVINVKAGDIAFAHACTLFPGGTARPIAYIVRNAFQYLGAVLNITTVGGMSYVLDGMAVPKFRVHNYMHEPGVAVQTQYVLRVPWIGADLNTLNTLATTAGVVGFNYTNFYRSFTHCVGTLGSAGGNLFEGCSVVPDDQNGSVGAGHFRPFDSTKHAFDQICGRVLSIEQVYPPRDYADRVRTQFDRAQQFVGPFADSHPTTQLMGGSATRGAEYATNLATNGLLRKLIDAGVTPANIPAECGTMIWIGFRSL